MANVGVEGTAYYDGQFKRGIPEGLIKHYCFLKPFSVTNSPVQHYRPTSGVIHKLTKEPAYSLQKACCHFCLPHNCTGLPGPGLPSTKRYQVTKR